MSAAALLTCHSAAVLADGDETDKSFREFREIEQQRGYPVRGMSVAAVLKKYGEPDSRSDPVGRPPISSWHYADFLVYFEHRLVITTVAIKDHLPTEPADIQ